MRTTGTWDKAGIRNIDTKMPNAFCNKFPKILAEAVRPYPKIKASTKKYPQVTIAPPKIPINSANKTIQKTLKTPKKRLT